MPILLKSPSDIARMQTAGAVVADVHAALASTIEPGITTRELDAIAHQMIVAAGGQPSFLGYRGYPASICASVNNVVLHGIPNDNPLADGDIVSIDIGVYLDGFHGDAAITHGVGRISPEAVRLIEVTEASFWAGYAELREGGRLGDATSRVQHVAESSGFSVIRDYAGHGVGRQMHEDPSVPNYGTPGTGTMLRKGMTFALEPMLAAGSPQTRVLEDGWTVVTIDGSLSAHYEHTIAIDGERAILLTGAMQPMI